MSADMSREEIAQMIEGMPIAVSADATVKEIELMMVGFQHAKRMAADCVRNPRRPLVFR